MEETKRQEIFARIGKGVERNREALRIWLAGRGWSKVKQGHYGGEDLWQMLPLGIHPFEQAVVLEAAHAWYMDGHLHDFENMLKAYGDSRKE